jgi:hypothetical protein
MPIYLVRWPDLSASLVKAVDEEELVLLLDDVGNADGCRWSTYDGPLFIDVRLPVEWSPGEASAGPLEPGQVELGSLGALEHTEVEEALELTFAPGEEGLRMAAEIIRQAFPVLHAALERFEAAAERHDTGEAISKADLRDALHGELVRAQQWSWRRAQLRLRSDPVSQLAADFDMAESLVRRLSEAETSDSGPDGDDGTS